MKNNVLEMCIDEKENKESFNPWDEDFIQMAVNLYSGVDHWNFSKISAKILLNGVMFRNASIICLCTLAVL